MMNDQQAMIDQIRKLAPSAMAAELVSVQPMDGQLFSQLMDESSSMTKQELLAAGYEPICPVTQLMWIKK